VGHTGNYQQSELFYQKVATVFGKMFAKSYHFKVLVLLKILVTFCIFCKYLGLYRHFIFDNIFAKILLFLRTFTSYILPNC
jgi:hypothetical protein